MARSNDFSMPWQRAHGEEEPVLSVLTRYSAIGVLGSGLCQQQSVPDPGVGWSAAPEVRGVRRATGPALWRQAPQR